MSRQYKILTINPGSTSTKIALYQDGKEVFSVNLSHPAEALAKYEKIVDQYDFRNEFIIKALKENSIDIKSIDAVVGRGGLLKPIPGGTYEVNEAMLKDLQEGKRGEHASNLGGILAYWLAKAAGCKSYIVDPVVVDEMNDLARISGNPLLPRISIFHALNQKAVARQAAHILCRRYEELNLIVAHLGVGFQSECMKMDGLSILTTHSMAMVPFLPNVVAECRRVVWQNYVFQGVTLRRK